MIALIALHNSRKQYGELEKLNRSIEADLDQRSKELSREKAAVIISNARIEELEKGLLYNPSNYAVPTLSAFYSANKVKPKSLFCESLSFKTIMSSALLDEYTFLKATSSGDLHIISQPDVHVKIRDDSGLTYSVSLNSCSCRQFIINKRPCRHMMWLALKVGVLSDAERTDGPLPEHRADSAVDNAFQNRNFASNSPFYHTETFKYISGKELLDEARFINAVEDSTMRLMSPPEIRASVKGQSGSVYTVTLDSCTCKDFQISHKPCKHMYKLAVYIGALAAVDNTAVADRIYDYKALRDEIAAQQRRLSKDREKLKQESEKERQKIIDERSKSMAALRKANSRFMSKLNNSGYNVSWLAETYGSYYDMCIGDLVDRLNSQIRPAHTTAAKIYKNYTAEMKGLAARAKRSEDLVLLYESFFPNIAELCDMKAGDLPPDIENSEASDTPKTEYESMRNWISRAEYDLLPKEEKFQLALENYKHRKRSNWEAGRDFERYICYRYEKDGYKVISYGAIKGLEDLGRDLYAFKDNKIIIIQCKRWASHKQVHEKHIYQLFGTVTDYSLENPLFDTTGLLISTCTLSDKARDVAAHIGIEYEENAVFSDYPMIKCNINYATGEKIYHLPFDQQYDKVQINYSKGELYAWTIKEAECKGFRRAFRHVLSSDDNS